MATPNIQVRSGNRISVRLDGKNVGLVQSVRVSEDYAPDPASGIGDIDVIEYVPTMARYSVAVNVMVLEKGALKANSIAPENSDIVLQGLVFDIVVYDAASGDELQKIGGCSYASGDIEITKHSIVLQSANFVALSVSGTKI